MVRCMTLYLVAQSCVLMGSDGTDLGMAAPGMGIEPAVMSIGPGPGIVWYNSPVGPMESAATLSQVHMPPAMDAVNVSAK